MHQHKGHRHIYQTQQYGSEVRTIHTDRHSPKNKLNAIIDEEGDTNRDMPTILDSQPITMPSTNSDDDERKRRAQPAYEYVGQSSSTSGATLYYHISEEERREVRHRIASYLLEMLNIAKSPSINRSNRIYHLAGIIECRLFETTSLEFYRANDRRAWRRIINDVLRQVRTKRRSETSIHGSAVSMNDNFRPPSPDSEGAMNENSYSCKEVK